MTNKPEVKRYKLESGHDSVMRRVNRMQESEGGVYVRFDDYEALQAECEKLRQDAERYRWLRDPCSGAERVVLYSRGDFGRGLMSYTMLDTAIDAHRKQ